MEIVPALAVKVAVVEPVVSVTEVGVVSNEVLLDKVTGRQPVGAAALKVIVQVPLAPEPKDDGEQASEVTVTSGDKLMEAVLEVPLSVAVMTAV